MSELPISPINFMARGRGGHNFSTRPSGDAREHARQRIVSLVVAFYIMVVFEGIARKWLLPWGHEYAIFLRDPLLAVIYVIALKNNLFYRALFLTILGIIGAIVSIFITLIQVMSGGVIVFELVAFAFRSYFFYIPLALVIGATFHEADITKLARVSLWICVPTAILMVIQFRYPSAHPINQGFGVTENTVFMNLGLIGELVRPFGLFTSTLGNTTYLAGVCVLAMFLLVRGRHADMGNKLFFVLILCTLLISVVFAGSRYLVFIIAAIVLSTLIGSVLSGQVKNIVQGLLWSTLLVVIGVLGGVIVFPEVIGAMTERFITANYQEAAAFEGGTLGRVVVELTRFIELSVEAPLFGYGFGMGNSAAYLRGHLPWGLYEETPWARHVLDFGGIFGIGFIGYRLIWLFFLTKLSFQAAFLRGNSGAFVLLGFIAPLLLIGHVTDHNTVQGLFWLFCGLLISTATTARGH